MEHHVVNRIPLRMGFQAVSSYFQTKEEFTDTTEQNITLFPQRKSSAR
jgi:hypothetical protein